MHGSTASSVLETDAPRSIRNIGTGPTHHLEAASYRLRNSRRHERRGKFRGCSIAWVMGEGAAAAAAAGHGLFIVITPETEVLLSSRVAPKVSLSPPVPKCSSAATFSGASTRVPHKGVRGSHATAVLQMTDMRD